MSRAVLHALLRRGLEDWMGDALSGPWDGVIDTMARMLEAGAVSLEDAAHLDHQLRRTRGDEGRLQCGTCHCPMPGMTHDR